MLKLCNKALLYHHKKKLYSRSTTRRLQNSDGLFTTNCEGVAYAFSAEFSHNYSYDSEPVLPSLSQRTSVTCNDPNFDPRSVYAALASTKNCVADSYFFPGMFFRCRVVELKPSLTSYFSYLI